LLSTWWHDGPPYPLRHSDHRDHIAELNKRAAETDLQLKRLYDAIEAGDDASAGPIMSTSASPPSTSMRGSITGALRISGSASSRSTRSGRRGHGGSIAARTPSAPKTILAGKKAQLGIGGLELGGSLTRQLAISIGFDPGRGLGIGL
jgi:hypothetical protein